MNWNVIHHLFPPKNQVEIAGDRLKCFVDAVKKIDERAEYNSMGQRKPIAGIRFFECFDCGLTYEEKTRDCFSLSVESCPNCFADNQPFKNEQHLKWAVDKSGNLI